MIPLCMALSSCDFLEEDPNSFVSQGDFFKSEEQCRSAVNSTYVGLRSVYSTTLFTHLEGTTDLIRVPSISDVNAILDINPSGCKISRTVWSQAYKCVMYSNYAVAGIETAQIDSTARLSLLSEAKTMRAYWYWLLTSCFGDVPFYTMDVSDADIMNEVAKYPRMSAYQTRKAMIEDLQSCFPYDTAGNYKGALEQIRTYDMAETGRAGWAMGMTLIGKMALWNACDKTKADSSAFWYKTGLDALLKVAEVYGDLSQYPLEELKFKYKNTPERIFEIQHTYINGQLNYSGGLATNCMPTHKKETSVNEAGDTIEVHTFNGVEIPELGTQMKVGTCNRPNRYFFQGVQPDNDMDLRAEINMALEYNGKNFSTRSNPYMGPKFWCPYMYQTYDSNNYPVFRYADVLLMIAECYCGLEDQENYLKYLNMVKSRAGLPDYVFQNWTKAHKEIRDERARELFGEFQRKFDLVRWDIWYESVVEHTDMEELLKNIKPCHRYLPIHDTQVIYSGYALDNNEYNQYGL